MPDSILDDAPQVTPPTGPNDTTSAVGQSAPAMQAPIASMPAGVNMDEGQLNALYDEAARNPTEAFNTALQVSKSLPWAAKYFQGVSPDDAAKIDTLAKAYNVPFPVAQAGKQDMQTQQEAQAASDLATAQNPDGTFKYPVLSKMLTDPVMFAKSKDDLPALAQLEQAAKGWQQQGEGTGMQTARDSAANILGTVSGIMRTVGVLGQKFYDGDPDMQGADAGYKPSDTDPTRNAIGNLGGLTPWVEQITQQLAAKHKDNEGFLSDITQGDIGGATKMGVSSIVGSAALIAAAVADPALGYGAMASSSFGETYKRDQDSGIKTEGQSLADAGISSVISTALQSIGGVGAVHSFFEAISKAPVNQTLAQGFQQLLKVGGLSAARDAAAQGGANAVNQLSDYATGNPEGLKDIGAHTLDAGLLGAIQGFGFASLGTAANAITRNAQQTEGRAKFDQIMAVETKTAERDPDTVSDTVNLSNHLDPRGPMTVSIDSHLIEPVFNGDEAKFQQFAKDMGTTVENIRNDAAVNGETQLDLGQLKAKYQGTDILDKLNKDFLFAPGNRPIEDITPHIEELKQALNNLEGTDPDSVVGQLKGIRDQLVQEQGMSVPAANSQVGLLHAGITRFAQRSGESVENLYKRIGLQLKTGGHVVDENGKKTIKNQTGENENDALSGLRDIGHLPKDQFAQNDGRIKFQSGNPDLRAKQEPMVLTPEEQKDRITSDEHLNDLRRHLQELQTTGGGVRSPEGQTELRPTYPVAIHSKTGLEKLSYANEAEYAGQIEHLLKWAEAKGLVKIPEHLHPDLIAEGGEHAIYGSVKGVPEKVFKFLGVPHPKRLNPLPMEAGLMFSKEGSKGVNVASTLINYIDRIFRTNSIFRSTINFEGVDPEGNLITSQRFAPVERDAKGNEIPPTLEEVKERMKLAGFASHPDGESYYRNDGVFMTDMGPKNFRRAPNGDVVPIDALSTVLHPEITAKLESAFGPSPYDPAHPEAFYQGEQAAYYKGDTGNKIIHLFDSANMSSFPHEVFHLLMDLHREFIEGGLASDEVKADWAAMEKWAGGDLNNPDNEEKLARGWEQYLREGKAPSIELTTAFDRFRSWLCGIYKNIRSLGQPIDDSIRGVFDRLLASQQDTAEAEQFYRSTTNDLADLMFSTGKQMGPLSAEEENKRRALAEKRAQTQADSNNKQAAAYVKAYQSIAGGKAGYLERAKATVEGQQIYKAIVDGKTKGIDGRSLLEHLSAADVEAIKKKFPGLLKAPNKGASADEMAAKHGFDSPEHFARSLANAAPMKEAIEAQANQQMAIDEANIRSEYLRSGATPADGATHTDKSLSYMVAELKVLADRLTGARNKRAAQIRQSQVTYVAKKYLDNQPFGKAGNVALYAKQEAALGREAIAAAKRGDWDACYDAREAQIKMHAVVMESIKRRDIKQEFERRWTVSKVNSKLENVEDSYRDPIKTILDNWEICGVKPKTPADLSEKAMADLDYGGNLAALIPDWIGQPQTPAGKRQPSAYLKLPFEKVVQLDAALHALFSVGSDKLKSIRDEKNASLAEGIAEQMKDLAEAKDYDGGKADSKNPVIRAAQKTYNTLIAGYRACKLSQAQLPYLAKEADGFRAETGRPMGFMERMLNGVKAGEGKEYRLRKAFMTEVQGAMPGLHAAIKRLEKENGAPFFKVDGLRLPDELKGIENGTLWSGMKLITAVMHTSNEGNLDALKSAYGFDDNQIALLRKQFTAEEHGHIQRFRDALGMFGDELDGTHFRLYNSHIEKVDGLPATFQTKDGKTITDKGGYVPLHFDFQALKLLHSVKNSGGNLERDIETNRRNAVMRVAPDKGMTATRVQGHGYPPDLSFHSFFRNAEDTIHFITRAEAAQDWNKFTRNAEWQKLYSQKFGTDSYAEIRKWLGDYAAPKYDPQTAIDKIAAWNRNNATLALLGGNVASAASWYSSVVSGISRLHSPGQLDGYKWMAKAYGAMAEKGGLSTAFAGLDSPGFKWICSQSDFMADRAHSITPEQAATRFAEPGAQTFTIAGKRVSMQQIHDFGFKLTEMGDRIPTALTWMAAHLKYMETMADAEKAEEETLKDSVRFADDTVRATQPTKAQWEMSAQQRSSSQLVKLYTMFMNWSIKFGNIAGYKVRAWQAGKMSTADLSKFIAHEVVLEPIMRATIHSAVRGALPTASVLAAAPLAAMVQNIAVLNQLPQSVADYEDDPKKRFDLGDAFAKLFESAGGLQNVTQDLRQIQKAYEHGGDYQTLWAWARLGSYVTKMSPYQNFVKEVADWWAKAEGDDQFKKEYK